VLVALSGPLLYASFALAAALALVATILFMKSTPSGVSDNFLLTVLIISSISLALSCLALLWSLQNRDINAREAVVCTACWRL